LFLFYLANRTPKSGKPGNCKRSAHLVDALPASGPRFKVLRE
jgi:hypothetical protein